MQPDRIAFRIRDHGVSTDWRIARFVKDLDAARPRFLQCGVNIIDRQRHEHFRRLKSHVGRRNG